MKILIVAFVVGCVIALAFRSCHHSTGQPAKQEDKKGFFGAFHAAAEGDGSRLGVGKDKKSPKGSYDLYSERLRAECGSTFLRTDAGQYEIGRMSNKGYVLAIRDRIVRVVGPEGRPGFVVCDDSSMFLPADMSASTSEKPVVGSSVTAGTPAQDRKALFRTGGSDVGGSPVSASPVVVSKSGDGPRPTHAADWWPASVPGW